jgi:all-trans-retinol 13,14-reductase
LSGKYDIIIIGSGLGGLVCGYILAKEGYHVCILEKNHQVGGNLQTFTRDGHKFDTGLHYFGSMDEGQTLYRFFKYLGLTKKLMLRKLDDDGYDVLTFGDDAGEYKHAQGYDQFEQVLQGSFPHERANIAAYGRMIRDTIKSIPLYDLDNTKEYTLNPLQISRCAMAAIRSVAPDKKLRYVLAGANSMYHGAMQRTPLYVHACIRNSFIESAWRPVDGSDQIASYLVESIRNQGGTVLMNSEVCHLLFDDEKISGVTLKDGRRFEAGLFISNAHPAVTLGMIDPAKIRKAYRVRLENLENTPGIFSLYLVFKENTFPYLNYNYFYYDTDRYFTDDADDTNWPATYLLYTPARSVDEAFSATATIMSFMNFRELKRWSGIPRDQRGEGYDEFREKKAEQLLNLAEKKFPGLRGKVERYFISTPLTFEDFTATKDGSAYGILKDCENPAKSIILPRTKIPNLMFTGQNLNIHGVLGTTISAVITCSEIVGFRYLLDKITHA